MAIKNKLSDEGLENTGKPIRALPPDQFSQMQKPQPRGILGFLSRIFSVLKSIGHRFLHWLVLPVPRWRPITAMFLLYVIVWSVLLYGAGSIFAASFTFSQTSWSGGADTATVAVHPTNETGWNKYYSTTNTDTSGGTVKTATFSSTKNENFSTTNTTADKDGANTSAIWKASTALSGLNLVAYWKMDDPSGLTMSDSSGNTRTLTCDGSGSDANTTVAPLQFSNPFSRTISSNVNGCQSSNATGLGLDTATDEITIAMWVKGPPRFINGHSPLDLYGVYQNAAPRLNFAMGDNGFLVFTGSSSDSNFTVTSSVALTDSAWHHLAAVRGNGRVKIYIDGTETGDAADTLTTWSSYNVANPIGTAFTTSLIDDLRGL
jgi:hypothetical protein